MIDPLTAAEAATAIVQLINSRSTSPRQDELIEIIARVGLPRDAVIVTPDCPLVQWNARIRAFRDAQEDDTNASDEAASRLEKAFCADCEQQWAKPVRSMADVWPLLMIAVAWNMPLDIGDPAYPYNVIAETDPNVRTPPGWAATDERALAFLARGLLEFGKLRFAPDGRLWSVGLPIDSHGRLRPEEGTVHPSEAAQ